MADNLGMKARTIVRAKEVGYKRSYLYEVQDTNSTVNSAIEGTGYFIARRVVENSRNGIYRVMRPTMLRFSDVEDVFIVVI